MRSDFSIMRSSMREKDEQLIARLNFQLLMFLSCQRFPFWRLINETHSFLYFSCKCIGLCKAYQSTFTTKMAAKINTEHVQAAHLTLSKVMYNMLRSPMSTSGVKHIYKIYKVYKRVQNSLRCLLGEAKV